MKTTDMLLFIAFLFINTFSSSHATIHDLQPESKHDIPKSFSENLEMFCYGGQPKYLFYLWKTVKLQLNINSDNYKTYDGATPQDVHDSVHNSKWTINLFSWKKKNIYLDPFNRNCIGIVSQENYSVNLKIIRVDLLKVILTCAGISLYFLAGRLSNNVLFYYICSIFLGNVASFVILIFVLSKIFPKKPMMYGFIVGGWTLGFYLLQYLYENLRLIMYSYYTYVIYYILVTSLISFIICYRLGPVTNPRSKNLIKWALQSFGVAMIYFSTWFQEAALGIIMIIFLLHNFPGFLSFKYKAFWRGRFPAKITPLTKDQFYKQGIRETSKALNELRDYCSSPDCNQWKTVLKLKDAKRFASFVEGESHLSDEEILNYENDTTVNQNNFTDEEFTDDSSDSVDL